MCFSLSQIKLLLPSLSCDSVAYDNTMNVLELLVFAFNLNNFI